MAGPILLYPAFRHFRGFPRLWKYHWNPTTLSRRKFRLSIYPVGKDRARNNDSNLLMSSRAVFAASSTRKCLRCWPVGYKGLTIYLRVRGFMRRTARKTSRRRYFYLTFVPLCILALKEKWRKWGESSVYTGGLRLRLFTNLVLVLLLKRGARRGKRALFLECQERKTDYIRSGRGGHRGTVREGGGAFFCEYWETSIVTGFVSKR